MKRRCSECEKIKKVWYRAKGWDIYYCSKECLYKKLDMESVRNIKCAVCDKPIGEHAIFKDDYDSYYQKFYCCEDCMLKDIGVIKEDN